MDAGPGGRAERYVPRPYWIAAMLRIVAPGLVRRVTQRGANRLLMRETAEAATAPSRRHAPRGLGSARARSAAGSGELERDAHGAGCSVAGGVPGGGSHAGRDLAASCVPSDAAP